MRRRYTVPEAPPAIDDVSFYSERRYPALRLSKDFLFSHEPINQRLPMKLLARKETLEAFKMRIRHSSGGAFLITGYRGVGKTSFVNAALEELEHEIKDAYVLPISINLSRTLSPTEIMHHIVRQISTELEARHLYQRLKKPLRQLIETSQQRTAYAMSYSKGISATHEGGLTPPLVSGIGVNWRGSRSVTQGQSLEFLGYDDKSAEYDIIRILRGLNVGYRRWGRTIQIRPVIVFDELDKLNLDDEAGRTYLLDTISVLKAILTTSGSIFVFIGGTDLYRVWSADVRKPNSIYESVFAYELYLPCLWELPEAFLATVLQPGGHDAKEQMWRDHLRYHLAYVGRGVPRRMIRELNRLVSTDSNGLVKTLSIRLDDPLQQRVRAYADMELLITQNSNAIMRELDEHVFNETQFDEFRQFLYYIVDYVFATKGRSFTRENAFEFFQSYPLFLESVRAGQVLIDVFLRILVYAKYLEASNNEFKLTEFGNQRAKQATSGDYTAPMELPNNGVVGDYRLLRLLGTGGIADVYEAQRWYETAAFKILHAKEDVSWMRTSRQMMQREREILGMNLHPNIVRLISLGETEPVNYFAMEVLDGISLDDVIRTSKTGIDAEVAVSLICALCEPVEAIHHQGFYRLDLTPSNVIIETGTQKRVVLFDLGTAIQTLAVHAEAKASTFAASDEELLLYKVIGTSGFMSPEAAEITPESTFEPRIDVYALGMILYLLLVGRRGASALHGNQNIDLNQIQDLAIRFAVENATARHLDRRTPTVAAFREQLQKRTSFSLNKLSLDEAIDKLQGVDRKARDIRTPIRTTVDNPRTEIEKLSTDIFPSQTPPTPAALALPKIESNALPEFVNSIQLRVYASETTDTTIPGEPTAQVFKFLPDTRITIGRAFDNALLLDDELVSRYNAAIFSSTAGLYLVEKMRDSAHVFVDGVPIERETPLVHGSNLTIGKTVIQFLLSDENLNVTRID